MTVATRRGMVLELGEGVVRTVLGGKFADDEDTLRAMEMHMALSEPRTRFKKGWARMAAIEADPACWEVLARWAYAQSRIPPGVRKAERAQARRLKSMAEKITLEIERLSAHPAYRNIAVRGHGLEILPAYRVVLENCHTFLAPTPGVVMELSGYVDAPIDRGHLEPQTRKMRGIVYTEWKFVSAPE